MNPDPPGRRGQARLLWALWFSILAGLVFIYFEFGRDRPLLTDPTFVTNYLGVIPLIFSGLLRWWVMPRVSSHGQALVVMVAGLALAEGCGLMGIFFSQYREALVVLAELGIVQWIPVFASRLKDAPARGARE